MKPISTFLFLLAFAIGFARSAQAQIISATLLKGQKEPIFSYASSQSGATSKTGARMAVDCNLFLIFESGVSICAGSSFGNPTLLITGIGVSSPCHLGQGPAVVELSDASGSFANSTTLTTAPSLLEVFTRFVNFSQPLVTLPANLPSGTNYKIRVLDTSSGSISDEAGPFTIHALPIVSITPATTTVYSGQSVTLTAAGASSYSWSTGANTSSITFSAPAGTTTYSVTGTDENGCPNTATATVTGVLPPSLSSVASICVKTSPPSKVKVTLPISMTLSGGVGPFTYSWAYQAPGSTYKSIPAGGTTIGKVSFTPVANSTTLNISGEKGNLNGLAGYVIRLTVVDRNGTSTSATTLLDDSCRLESAQQSLAEVSVQVQVWPNPMQEVLQLRIDGLNVPAQVHLYDVAGRPTGHWVVEPVAGSGSLKAPLDKLSEGLYFLRVETTAGVLHSQRVLKQR
jgi:hypothetical protein